MRVTFPEVAKIMDETNWTSLCGSAGLSVSHSPAGPVSVAQRKAVAVANNKDNTIGLTTHTGARGGFRENSISPMLFSWYVCGVATDYGPLPQSLCCQGFGCPRVLRGGRRQQHRPPKMCAVAGQEAGRCTPRLVAHPSCRPSPRLV